MRTKQIRQMLCDACVIAVAHDELTDAQLDELVHSLTSAMAMIIGTPRGRVALERVKRGARTELATRMTQQGEPS